MRCELQPALKRQDEPALRKALARLRDMAPPDAGFESPPRPWSGVVDEMLESGNWLKGCGACHSEHKRRYARDFGPRQVGGSR